MPVARTQRNPSGNDIAGQPRISNRAIQCETAWTYGQDSLAFAQEDKVQVGVELERRVRELVRELLLRDGRGEMAQVPHTC